MASTYITRTQTTGDRQKMTWSFWIKKSVTTQRIFNAINANFNSSYVSSIHFNDDGFLTVYNVDGSSNIDVRPSRRYRDVNAWYHIVIAMDTTQSTASDRIKIYTNGVQETSFVNTTYPPQNANNTQWNYNGNNLTIGKRVYDTAQYIDGILSHFHFIDGTIYDPSAFGETDATTGQWKIKDNISVTYGNNGFFIFKDGTNLSGSTVQDQSGQSNNFTAYGNLTKTEDCPNNVFATMNPLDKNSNVTLTNGNLKMTSSATNVGCRATIGASSGKWFWEVKIEDLGGYGLIGIAQPTNWNLNFVGSSTTSYAYGSGGETYTGGSTTSYGTSWTTNDIIGVALDMDNATMVFYKNGISQGTAFTGITTTDFMLPAFSGQSGTDFLVNFGNGYFGTTAVSSAGTNASGNGIFEYDVPTGFTALSTKGLNL